MYNYKVKPVLLVRNAVVSVAENPADNNRFRSQTGNLYIEGSIRFFKTYQKYPLCES